MNREKLKKIAEMARRGTPAEQRIAKKLLRKYNVTVEELLDPPSETDTDIDDYSIDIDAISSRFINDINKLFKHIAISFIDKHLK